MFVLSDMFKLKAFSLQGDLENDKEIEYVPRQKGICMTLET